MDKKSLILVYLIFFSIIISAGLSFFKFVFLKDYYVEVAVACNPAKERCFVKECDQTEEDCGEEGRTYYKLLDKKASALIACNIIDEKCISRCESESICSEKYCEADNPEEGIACNDPMIYKAGL